MPYNSLTIFTFHIKKLCSSFLQVKCNFTQKTAVLSSSWGLRGNVRCSSYAHWKVHTVVDFLLVLVKLFQLVVTAEVLQANID